MYITFNPGIFLRCSGEIYVAVSIECGIPYSNSPCPETAMLAIAMPRFHIWGWQPQLGNRAATSCELQRLGKSGIQERAKFSIPLTRAPNHYISQPPSENHKREQAPFERIPTPHIPITLTQIDEHTMARFNERKATLYKICREMERDFNVVVNMKMTLGTELYCYQSDSWDDSFLSSVCYPI
jgi:hypothetical protein